MVKFAKDKESKIHYKIIGAVLAITFIACLSVIFGSSRDFLRQPDTSLAETYVFTPRKIAFSENEIPNPGRGLYTWHGLRYVCPANLISNQDQYHRYSWKDIETSQGSYNWANVTNLIQNAKNKHQRVVIGLVQSSKGGNSGISVPSYLVKENVYGKTVSGTYLLNWNNSFVRSRLSALLDDFDRKFGNESAIDMIQMFSYGQYGEGYIPSSAPSDSIVWISDANAEWMVNLYHSKFSGKFKLSVPAFNKYMFKYAMTKQPFWGISRTALGDQGQMSSLDTLSNSRDVIDGVNIGSSVKDRWKYAPLWTEMIGNYTMDYSTQFATALNQVSQYHVSYVSNGNFHAPYDVAPWKYSSSADSCTSQSSSWTQSNINDFVLAGKRSGYRYSISSVTVPTGIRSDSPVSITSQWLNEGVAPTYDNWNTVYQLVNSSGSVLWEGASRVNLKTVLPSSSVTTITDTYTLGNIPPGSYRLKLKVKPLSRSVSANMALAIDGRDSDGAYAIGTVTVENSGANQSSSPIPSGTSAVPNGAIKIVAPRQATPAFIQPGDTFIAEVKDDSRLTPTGWTARVSNDLRSWDAQVVSVTKGLVNNGRDSGWKVTIRPTSSVPPELLSLTLSHSAVGSTTTSQSVSVVQNFESNFYILQLTDEHVNYPSSLTRPDESGHDVEKEGYRTSELVDAASDVVNILNPRFVVNTGDVTYQYINSTYTRQSADMLTMYKNAKSHYSVPSIIIPGNHDIPKDDETKHVAAASDWEQKMGLRSYAYRLGSFFILAHDYSDSQLKAWSDSVFSANRSDNGIKYRLVLQHFKDWNSILNNRSTPAGCNLMMIGHLHHTNNMARTDGYNSSVDPSDIRTGCDRTIMSIAAHSYARAGVVSFNNVRDSSGSTSRWDSDASSFSDSSIVSLIDRCGVVNSGFRTSCIPKVKIDRVNDTTVRVVSDINRTFPDGRVRFTVPRGVYRPITGGEIIAQYDYAADRTAVLMRVAISQGTKEVSIERTGGGASNSPTPTSQASASPSPVQTLAPTINPTSQATFVPSAASLKSTLIVQAAGVPYSNVYPKMSIRVNDQVFTTVTVYSKAINNYTFNFPYKVLINQLKVSFDNDAVDRDLRVDRVILDGVTYESIASNTYSTGTWSSSNGCGAGYKQSVWLNCPGYFLYNAR